MPVRYCPTWNTVLRSMSRTAESNRERLAFLIAWGVTNNFHLFIGPENYARFAVRPNWEVLDASYPLRGLARGIEEEISQLLPTVTSREREPTGNREGEKTPTRAPSDARAKGHD